jgi:hypothetical protein
MAMDATSYQGGRRAGGGQSAAAPNPSQPQLKAVPMIAKMEEAKRRLRMPFQPGGGPAPRGMREPGGGMSPGGPGGGLPRGVRVMPSGPMDQATSGPSGPPTTGGEMPLPPGAELNGGPRVEDDPYSMLPPRMRETARAAGRDPQEAVASRMANDPTFRQQIIQQYGPGAPGGPPAGGPTVSTGGPDMSVSGPGGMSPGSPGPGLPPPGAEPGGQVPPQIALQQRLQGTRQRGFNPGSLADLYGQFTGRGGPPQYGGAGGGPSPFGFGQMGAYRG